MHREERNSSLRKMEERNGARPVIMIAEGSSERKKEQRRGWLEERAKGKELRPFSRWCWGLIFGATTLSGPLRFAPIPRTLPNPTRLFSNQPSQRHSQNFSTGI